MRFYPKTYHLHRSRNNTEVHIFAYTVEGSNVLIRIPYYYWFYVKVDKPYNDLYNIICTLPGAIPDKEHNIVERDSTLYLHETFKCLKVSCITEESYIDAIDKLPKMGVRLHDYDKLLTPITKLTVECGIDRYCWMDIDTYDLSSNDVKYGKWQNEYFGVRNTLKKVTDQIPPPPFSICSIDIETNSTDWRKIPKASAHKDNAINIACMTFAGIDYYEEHALVFGPDIANVYKKYVKHDMCDTDSMEQYVKSGVYKNGGARVFIHTFKTELELIYKIFELINEKDPDIIIGHNTTNFDYPYIYSRMRHAIMINAINSSNKTTTTFELPNISRLLNYKCTNINVKWNNNQVAMQGMYPDMPGRIWIDTLILAARSFLGQLPNNKLDTLGNIILGMSKNDVTHIDMFKTFKYYKDYTLAKASNGFANISLIENSIDELYVQLLKKHNISKLDRIDENIVTIQDLNRIIAQINQLDQRSNKEKLREAKEVRNKNFNIKTVYNDYYARYELLVARWNIPSEVTISISDKLQVLWWIITMYCFQDTRIPYQVVVLRDIVPILCAQSSIFNGSIIEILMQGQVKTVIGSQYVYNYRNGVSMDFGTKGGIAGVYKYGGGFVGKNEPGMKTPNNDCVVIVIDFASLYPTIIISHNLCYTTYVLGIMRNHESDRYIWKLYEHKIPKLREKYETILKNLNEDNEVTTYLFDAMGGVQELKRLSSLKELSLDDTDTLKDLRNTKAKLATIADDTEKYKRFLSEIIAIIDAPFEKKGELMCNTYTVYNDDEKQDHHHWFLKECIKKGTVPSMLWEQFKSRRHVKRLAAEAKARGDYAMAASYDAQEKAIKVSMNSTYGGFGTKSNRLANFAVAETITFLGRTGIQLCNDTIAVNKWGDVVYNDTDSAMVRINDITKQFNRETKRIKEYGFWIAEELSKLFPKPMSIECENFFVSFFLKGPKMYSGIKWDGNTVEIDKYNEEYIKLFNLQYIKGMAPARRDKYKFNKEAYRKVLSMILQHENPDNILKFIERCMVYLWNALRSEFGKLPIIEQARIVDLFSYSMGVSPKAYEGTNDKATMSKWVKIHESKYGAKPASGSRPDLLVTNYGVLSHPDSRKHTKSAYKLVTREWLLEENRTIDVIHYIEVWGKDGNILDIYRIAYPGKLPKNTLSEFYLPSLRTKNSIIYPQ